MWLFDGFVYFRQQNWLRIKALRPDIVSLGQGPLKDVGPVKVAIVRMAVKVD